MSIQAIVNNTNTTQTNQVSQSSNIKTAQETNPVVKSYENSYVKTDNYFGAAVSNTNKSYEQFMDFAKKLLYNPQFREVAINSNEQLKEAYNQFTSALEGDNSKLGEYIKSMLGDSSKFSGEFFSALNLLANTTESSSMRESIYNLLKAFDNYYTQNQNAFSVNSSINDILSQMPKEIQNRLLNILVQNNSKNLTDIMFSIFDTKLPNEEKAKLALSFLSDLTNNYNTIKEELPSNVLIPEKLSREALDVVSTLVKEIKDLNLNLPESVKNLLNSINANGNTNTVLNPEQKEVLNQLVKLMTSSKVISDVNVNIDSVIRSLVNIRDLATTSLENKSQINEIINLLSNLKALDSKVLIDIVSVKEGFLSGNINKELPLVLQGLDKENLTGEEIKGVLETIKALQGNNLLNGGILSTQKDDITALLNNLMGNLLDKVIYGYVDKNKSELLLNVYEKNFMPEILKNNDILDKNSVSILTHNMLRLKNGTAGEFSRNINNLMQFLTRDGSITADGKLTLQMNLVDKLLEAQRNIGNMGSLLYLMDVGVKNASNDSVKAMFQNALFSMLPRTDVDEAVKNYFLPFFINGQNVMSQLSIKKKKDEEGKTGYGAEEDSIYEITLIMDVERKGEISANIRYRNGEVSANILLPEKIEFGNGDSEVSDDIIKIIDSNNLVAKNINVSRKIS